MTFKCEISGPRFDGRFNVWAWAEPWYDHNLKVWTELGHWFVLRTFKSKGEAIDYLNRRKERNGK